MNRLACRATVHFSQRPANANGVRSGRWIRNGLFFRPSVFHSKNPSAAIRQRRLARNAERNDGFSATVSDRALMSLLPIDRSCAHNGIKPQRSMTASRSATDPSLIARICWVGATLYLGWISRRRSRSNIWATSSGRAVRVNLAHIGESRSGSWLFSLWLVFAVGPRLRLERLGGDRLKNADSVTHSCCAGIRRTPTIYAGSVRRLDIRTGDLRDVTRSAVKENDDSVFAVVTLGQHFEAIDIVGRDAAGARGGIAGESLTTAAPGNLPGRTDIGDTTNWASGFHRRPRDSGS